MLNGARENAEKKEKEIHVRGGGYTRFAEVGEGILREMRGK